MAKKYFDNLPAVDAKALNTSLGIPVNVKHYGAKGDGVTDDTASIDAVMSTNKDVYFPSGTYLYNGKIVLTNTSSNRRKIFGDGSSLSIIEFTDNTVDALIERIDKQTSNFTIQGISFKGFGKGVGSCSGFVSKKTDLSSVSYNLRMLDVAVTNVSGDGFVVTDWFQQYWEGCYAREIGGDGFIIGGDQSTIFVNTGSFNLNIDGYSWWFISGNPTLLGLNTGSCGNGIKFGSTTGETKYAKTSYCVPFINGINIEGVAEGGTGLYFHNSCYPSFIAGVRVYANNVTATNGVYFDYIPIQFIIPQTITFYEIGTGTFTNKININGGTANSGILYFTTGAFTASGSAYKRLITINTNSGGELVFNNSVNFNSVSTINYTQRITKYRTITASENIRRDSGVQGDYIFLVDATSGQIDLSFDYGTYLAGYSFYIKKIDSSVNIVRINPITNIDGADYYDLNNQYQSVKIWASGNGNDWTILSKG